MIMVINCFEGQPHDSRRAMLCVHVLTPDSTQRATRPELKGRCALGVFYTEPMCFCFLEEMYRPTVQILQSSLPNFSPA